MFYDADGNPVERRRIKSPASALLVDKGNYRHFMAKEIHEQPEVVARTLAHYLDMSAGRTSRCPSRRRSMSPHCRRLTICGCGTAYYRGADRQILVRALRAAAGRCRDRLGISLPRSAAWNQAG